MRYVSEQTASPKGAGARTKWVRSPNTAQDLGEKPTSPKGNGAQTKLVRSLNAVKDVSCGRAGGAARRNVGLSSLE